MKFKRRIACVVAILMAVSITGCSSKKDEDNNSAVRIGYFPNITHAQALVGLQQGQFKKYIGDKYPIEWEQFNAGPAEMEALFAGEVDIGYIGPGPAISAYTKSNGDIQIIAGAANAGAVLVERKGANIKSIKDLQGKKVAVPQYGNTQDISLRALLMENGLKDSTKGGTVQIFQAENPDIKTLLGRGSVDAAMVPEPWGSRLVQEVGAQIVLDYNQVWRDGDYSSTVVVARKEFIKQHPDVVENFLRAHVEITSYINANNDEAKKVINNELGILTKKKLKTQVLNNAFKRIIVTNNPNKEAVDQMADLTFKIGFLRQEPDLKNLFYLDLLNKVLKEKGEQEIN